MLNCEGNSTYTVNPRRVSQLLAFVHAKNIIMVRLKGRPKIHNILSELKNLKNAKNITKKKVNIKVITKYTADQMENTSNIYVYVLCILFRL